MENQKADDPSTIKTQNKTRAFTANVILAHIILKCLLKSRQKKQDFLLKARFILRTKRNFENI